FFLISKQKHEHSSLLQKDWPIYGGNAAGNRYSALDQINVANVKDLQIAWIYNSNDTTNTNESHEGHEIECQPIVVSGVLYGVSATLKLFALEASTGRLLWKFNPFADNPSGFTQNRGVIYWENGNDKRILYAAGSFLFAVNAITGKAIAGFGTNGKIDLHEGLNINYDTRDLYVACTSPGVVCKNTLIIGSAVSEGGDAAPGYLRGFDVLNGSLKWTFHTVPLPGEAGYDTWPKDAYKRIGAANNWSGLTLDEKRGLVYFGTGAPASDFYGGARAGTNLFSDCIIAMDAQTGKVKWYFQTIHHDLWDRDIPCPPNLVTIRHDGKMIDVLVQATKDGLVYVLDREKGKSLYPIVEKPVPTHGLPGEHPWPTQKYPLKPLPFDHQTFSDSDITNISPESNAFIKAIFDQTKHGNKFEPPGIKGTILSGYSGGAEWGGNSIDPDGILYQNANHAPWLLKMISRKDQIKESAHFAQAEGLYVTHCSTCHGIDRKGNGKEVLPLLKIGSKLNRNELITILKKGMGRMPSFEYLTESQRDAIVSLLLDQQSNDKARAAKSAKEPVPLSSGKPEKNDFPYVPEYVAKVWQKLTDKDGYPGIKPPWGTLNAINLNTGDYLWRVPLGEYPELTRKGIPITGTESYGGPLVTAGGLVFIAGTRDARIRAFDKKTGKVVWEYQLPAGGFATPITYMVDGKQYVAIAAGGGRGLKTSGTYVAFELTNKKD
ncbi:MAG TPA: PQQ-binding-like beta-propeller repeat protein, partial [Puia sp.]|nr:PQQ-binding-like beta-propeller repeat protein [Puia sp.]